MRNPIPLNGFMQIVIVVDNIETSLDSWCELFGIRRPELIIRKAEPNPYETYRGEPAFFGLKIAILDCSDRGFIIELHEPDENPSTFREFLDQHGNGVHHIGFVVGDARDAIVTELQDMGQVMRVVGVYPAGDWTVVDGEHSLGVNINIKSR